MFFNEDGVGTVTVFEAVVAAGAAVVVEDALAALAAGADTVGCVVRVGATVVKLGALVAEVVVADVDAADVIVIILNIYISIKKIKKINQFRLNMTPKKNSNNQILTCTCGRSTSSKVETATSTTSTTKTSNSRCSSSSCFRC